jgi:hypothetical protein
LKGPLKPFEGPFNLRGWLGHLQTVTFRSILDRAAPSSFKAHSALRGAIRACSLPGCRGLGPALRDVQTPTLPGTDGQAQRDRPPKLELPIIVGPDAADRAQRRRSETSALRGDQESAWTHGPEMPQVSDLPVWRRRIKGRQGLAVPGHNTKNNETRSRGVGSRPSASSARLWDGVRNTTPEARPSREHEKGKGRAPARLVSCVFPPRRSPPHAPHPSLSLPSTLRELCVVCMKEGLRNL